MSLGPIGEDYKVPERRIVLDAVSENLPPTSLTYWRSELFLSTIGVLQLRDWLRGGVCLVQNPDTVDDTSKPNMRTD